MPSETLIATFYVFILAAFLGYQVISRVPPLLHTPLMSATNAISGISLVGSLVTAGAHQTTVSAVLGFIFLYFMPAALLTFALLLTGLDLPASVGAAVASINNTAHGLHRDGPASNLHALTAAQTWICTGAMLLGTLVDELERRNLSTGLVTLCIGAGMGTATIIERV